MLDINFSTILFQIINFGILVVVLYFLLFKSIFKRVKQRKQEYEEMELAVKRRFEESELMKENLQRQIDKAQNQINEKILQAKTELKASQLQFIGATKKKAEKITRQAIETAHLEQKHLIDNFNEEITSSIIEIVKHILNKHSPEVIHTSMVDQTNKRVWELGKKEMDRVETIRRALKDREPTLTVETAFLLSKEQQAGFVRTFSALADKNVRIDIILNKDLGAGVRIRLGDFIINNSLDALLNKIKKEAEIETKKLLDKQNIT